MGVGSDTELRKTLAKFGGINLGYYAILFTWIFNSIFGFIDLVPAGDFVPLIVFIINLPGLVLISIQFYILIRSLGKVARMTKDIALKECVRYFLWGLTLIAVILGIIISLPFLLDWSIYGGILYYTGELLLGIMPFYILADRKARALMWVWISAYEANPSGENVLELIRTHPKGRWVSLAFKAVFGEGETRARAAGKLARLVTDQGEPEEDEDDIETKLLANEIDPTKHIVFEKAPQKTPVRPRDIRDGKCPNCGAPVTSPNARYCTGCGETFGESW